MLFYCGRFLFGAVLFSVSFGWASSTNSIGVIAALNPAVKQHISKTVGTQGAVSVFQRAHQHNPHAIYWVDRKLPDTYHVTLSLLHKKGGHTFTRPELTQLENQLNLFKQKARGLHINRSKGTRGYKANGYQLVLFTHSYQGGKEVHHEYNANTIHQLLKDHKNAPIAYANLVLRVGTQNLLSNDWKWQEQQFLNQCGSYLSKKGNHDLKTHITIANFYKYDASKYKITSHGNHKEIIDRKNPGAKIYNSPFASRHELQSLVDAFKAANGNFQRKGGKIPMNIDELHITERLPQGPQFKTITHARIKL
ncbi:MAG: hypothetical protein ACK5O7_02805 [Holosporales bacterium]